MRLRRNTQASEMGIRARQWRDPGPVHQPPLGRRIVALRRLSGGVLAVCWQGVALLARSWAAAMLGLVLLVGSPVLAQAPAAPSIESVTAADAALEVVWAAPSGVSGITAYDLRHIESDATDKSDDNWTVVEDLGSDLRSYTVSGLSNGTEYDIQMRAVTDVDGTWSATTTATPVPSAPTLTAGDTAVTVEWTTPADTDEDDVTAYDLRYIESSATDRADGNWTVVQDAWVSGPQQYVLSALTNSTGYDVQMRAVTDVDGTWSATGTGTPSETGDTRDTAATLPLDTSLGGDINAATDTDYYEIVVPPSTRLVVFTTGDVDTMGVLQESDGTEIRSNDDGHQEEGWENFFLWGNLTSGTYYVKVTSYGDDTGSYVLLAEVIPRSRETVQVDTITNGLFINREATFSLYASESTDVVIRATSEMDLQLRLLEMPSDPESMPILLDDNARGQLGWRWYHPLIRHRLTANKSYVVEVGQSEARVPDNARRTDLVSDLTLIRGPFTLHVEELSDAATSAATASSMTLGRAYNGLVTGASRVRYHRIDIAEPGNMEFYVAGDPAQFTVDLLDSAETSTGAHVYSIRYGPTTTGRKDIVREYLDAGTYYLKITATSGISLPTPYLVYVVKNRFYSNLAKYCQAASTTATSIEDPFYGCQWHLKNTGQFGGSAGEDIKIEDVWKSGHLGAGVNVLVVDTDFDIRHDDLADNIDTTRLSIGSKIEPATISGHGTNVMGTIAARDDDVGTRGVAPRATVYGFERIFAGGPDANAMNAANAMTFHMDVTHVSNNSWGQPSSQDLSTVPQQWEEALERGLTEGLGGKGVFYVFGTGNDALDDTPGNLDGYTNFYGVTAVCSVNNGGFRSTFSETGPHLWVCAPSNDRFGGISTGRPFLLSTEVRNTYSTRWGGNSAATPVVSGVAALVRAANADLTWRDVKLLLAGTARKNDPTNDGWETGALKYGSTSANYEYNHEYGFGVVDATAAVDAAAEWTNVPSLVKMSVAANGVDLAVPDDESTVASSVTMAPAGTGAGCRHEDGVFKTGGDGGLIGSPEFIEFVEINTDFEAPAFRDLTLKLVSPSGAVSTLSFPYRQRPHQVPRLPRDFRFGSARQLGEAAAGDWTLQIIDEVSGNNAATLRGWCLTIYGHSYRPGPTRASAAPGDGSLVLNWEPPTDDGASVVTGYELRHIDSGATDKSDAQWTVVAELGPDLRSHTVSGLTNGTEYDVGVRAVNSHGGSMWYTVTAIAASHPDPRFLPAETSWTVAENAPTGTEVGSPLTANDPDDDTLVYGLAGPDAAAFQIDSATGQVTVADGTMIDYEAGRSLDLAVTVSDRTDASGNADTLVDDTFPLAVSVTDVDEPPEISGSDDVSYAENGTGAAHTYTATDPEGVHTSFTWSLDGPDRDRFTLTDGTLAFQSPPDYENPQDANADNQYEVSIKAGDGTLTGTRTARVTVTDRNEPPTISGRDTIAHPEHATTTLERYTAADPDPLTSFGWSLQGPDRDRFTITDGTLAFQSPPDYENPQDANADNRYQLAVAVSDGTHTATRDVTVMVTDQEDQGSVTLLEIPQVGTPYPAALVDPDEPVSSQMWTWWRSDHTTGPWQRIPDATAAAYRPVGDDFDKYLQVRVTYTDRLGPGKTAQQTSAMPVRLGLTVAVAQSRVREGQSTTVTVTLDETTFQQQSLGLLLTGSALLGEDYTTTSTAEPTGVTWRINALPDSLNEPDETISIQIRLDGKNVDTAATIITIEDGGVDTFGHDPEPGGGQVPAASDGTAGDASVAVDIEGAGFAATGTETAFTAIVSDGVGISVVGWTVTGPGGFTVTSTTRRLAFAAPAAGAYTVSVSVDDVSGRTLAGSVTLTVLGDIARHHFVNEILWLAESGITRGCTAHSYCPDTPVTRGQMASLLARALGLETPHRPAGFADVAPTDVHAAGIEALFAAQITAGCAREPLQFCPDTPVTRGQMASLLARALGLETPHRPAGFADVAPTDVHAAGIEALFAAQITAGCAREPLQFCPDTPVTRAQIAAFFYRALSPIAVVPAS